MNDMLYRGTVLEDAQTWTQHNTASVDEIAFVGRRQKLKQHRKAEEAHIGAASAELPACSGHPGVVFVMALAATIAAMVTAQDAQNDRGRARTQQALAYNAQANAEAASR